MGRCWCRLQLLLLWQASWWVLAAAAALASIQGLLAYHACTRCDRCLACALARTDAYLPCPAKPPQVAASPEVTVVSVADVPAEILEKEKAIEMEKEDIKSKPEQMRCVLLRRQVAG